MAHSIDADLVSFGNYLLSKERKVTIHKGHNPAQVYDTDLANWKERQSKPKPKEKIR